MKTLVLILAALPAFGQTNPVQQALAPAVQAASDAYDGLVAAYKLKGAQLTTANSIITSLSSAIASQNAQIAALQSRLAGVVGVIKLDPAPIVGFAPTGYEVLADGSWKPAPYAGRLYF